MGEHLQQAVGDQFDPIAALFRAYSTAIKVYLSRVSLGNYWHFVASPLLYAARHCEAVGNSVHFDYLDNLEHFLVQTKGTIDIPTFLRHAVNTNQAFWPLILFYGLRTYTRYRIDRDPAVIPSLSRAFIFALADEHQDDSLPEMIETLLNYGVDVNEPCLANHNRSTWSEYVEHLYFFYRPGPDIMNLDHRESHFQIAELLINCGADYCTEPDEYDTFKDYFGEDDADRLERIRARSMTLVDSFSNMKVAK